MRRSLLGLAGLPLASLFFASRAVAEKGPHGSHDDGIVQVGIDAVHPICDPLDGDCTARDEQAQDELIATLDSEADYTGKHH